MSFLSSGAFIGVFIAVLIFTVGIIVAGAFSNKGKTVTDKMKRLQRESYESDGDADDDDALQELQLYNQEKSGTALFLEKLLALTGVNMAKEEKRLVMKFAQSGINSPDAPAYYLFFKRFGIILVLPLIAFLIMDKGSPMLNAISYILIFVFGVAGLFGADLYLKNKKEKRQQMLMRSFPDALDLLLVCVEAGLALDAALNRVCKELESAHPLLSRELNITRMELTLLNDRPRALHNLAHRTDMIAFRQLVGALLQSEKFGTSLTETLRVLSEDFRYARLMAAENKAGRLPALMTIPLMLFLMPAFILVLMGPAIIRVMEIWK